MFNPRYTGHEVWGKQRKEEVLPDVEDVALGYETKFRLENSTREDALAAFPALQALPIPYIEPIDISKAVLFLASDDSRYVTGIQLRVDAGAYLKIPDPFRI